MADVDPAETNVEPTSALLAGRAGLLVRLSSQPGRRAALLDALNRYADGLAEEPGTEVFVVSVDPDDADVVWLYEIFRDEQAQLAHRASEGFAALMEEMPPLLAQPPGVLRLDPLRLSMQSAVLSDDLSL
jgi:quinol monooxygenase YgiN